MLETIAYILLAWFGLSLAFAFVWALAHHRKTAPPRTTARIGVKLTLHECSHCGRDQLWSTRFGPLTCICGGTYRDVWQELRVLREAAEIVRQAG